MEPAPISPPNEGLIQLLERLLKDAREGTILGIAGVVRRQGAEFGHYYDGDMAANPITYMGLFRMMQMRAEAGIEFGPTEKP